MITATGDGHRDAGREDGDGSPVAYDVDSSDPDRRGLLSALRRLQDVLIVPSDRPDLDRAARMTLEGLVAAYGEARGEELPARIYGLGLGERGFGQALVPPFVVTELTPDRLTGTVEFTRAFLGSGAVHGGAVALLFDDVLGRLSNHGRTRARTAYLHVNYRNLTPIDEVLHLEARIDRMEGRKRFLSMVVRHGCTIVADGNGLWVAPR